jgi:hypothetical protein
MSIGGDLSVAINANWNQIDVVVGVVVCAKCVMEELH